MKITGDFECFEYFNFETKFSEKRKAFLKKWNTIFYLNALQLKKQQFNTRLPCQKPVLRRTYLLGRLRLKCVTNSHVVTHKGWMKRWSPCT